jgi:hypothetical protein
MVTLLRHMKHSFNTKTVIDKYIGLKTHCPRNKTLIKNVNVNTKKIFHNYKIYVLIKKKIMSCVGQRR